jgi:hypothetical protein
MSQQSEETDRDECEVHPHGRIIRRCTYVHAISRASVVCCRWSNLMLVRIDDLIAQRAEDEVRLSGTKKRARGSERRVSKEETTTTVQHIARIDSRPIRSRAWPLLCARMQLLRSPSAVRIESPPYVV